MKRPPRSLRALQRAIGAMTRNGLRAGLRAGQRATKALNQATKESAQTRGKTSATVSKAGKRAGTGSLAGHLLADRADRRGLVDCVAGLALGVGGARRYYLYKPPGMALSERRPLLVMLHGCAQDANAFALSTRMNRIAAREGFLVLYPEQDRLANPQRCWNWYETRSRRAFAEAAIIRAAIDQVCLLYPVDSQRVGIAGLSAGAGMAALVAIRYPERFCAVAMHSGVPPGVADSTASAIRAMRGRAAAVPASIESGSPADVPGPDKPTTQDPTAAASSPWPPLLVIHGSADRVVAVSNAVAAARMWAAAAGATGETARQVQRGARYPMTVTGFGARGQVAATLCRVEGLGHAWSGGDARERFSDARGPDASRMVWAFMSRQFRRVLQEMPGRGALSPGGAASLKKSG